MTFHAFFFSCLKKHKPVLRKPHHKNSLEAKLKRDIQLHVEFQLIYRYLVFLEQTFKQAHEADAYLQFIIFQTLFEKIYQTLFGQACSYEEILKHNPYVPELPQGRHDLQEELSSDKGSAYQAIFERTSALINLFTA